MILRPPPSPGTNLPFVYEPDRFNPNFTRSEAVYVLLARTAKRSE